jgi:phosphoethanolamine N-methyltransferase
MDHRDNTLTFWEQHNADINSMLLNPNGMTFEAADTQEILSYLPNFEGQQILELAAGIGRFTKPLASVAKQVVAVDFVEKFIDKNKEINSNFTNITYHVGNAMDMNFDPACFDFVFVNWLFMYLEDDECQILADRISKWLKPKCQIFMRESCIRASNPNEPHPHTYYRQPEFYVDLFGKQFAAIANGNVAVYEKLYGNPNQLWWLFQKQA